MSTEPLKQTSNVRRLMLKRWSLILVPPGAGIAEAVKGLSEPGRLSAAQKEAEAWVKEAIALVRTAKGGEYANADDETIATEIMRNVEDRERKNRRSRRG